MAKLKRPKCENVLLEGGTSDTDRKFMDIAPTMQNITHNGRRYFRCPKSYAQNPDNGKWAMMYLWDGWVEWKYAQIKAEEAAKEST